MNIERKFCEKIVDMVNQMIKNNMVIIDDNELVYIYNPEYIKKLKTKPL